MEKPSTSIRVLTAFACIFLSVIFVLTAFVLPIYYSVAGLILPKTIASVVQKVDYVEIFTANADMDKIIAETKLDPAVFDEIIKSKEVSVLLEDFTGELTTVLLNPEGDLSTVNADLAQSVIDKHIDNILPVVEKKLGKTVVKETVRQGVSQIVKNNASAIDNTVTELAPVKETLQKFGTITKLVTNSLKWPSIIGVCLVEALLLGLMFLMRKYNFGGFIWIAVNTGIVGALVSGVALVLNSAIINDALSQLPGFVNGLANSIKSNMATKLTIALVICFVLMVASIVACVVLRARSKKLAATPTEEPVITTSEESV